MTASMKLIQASAGQGGLPIEYVGGATANGVNNSLDVSLTSLTGGIATSPSLGDIIIVIGGSAQSSGQTVAVTGYTLEVSSLQSLNTPSYTSMTMSVGWLESDGTETTATVTTTGGASNKPICGVAHVFRNVDTSTPFDVTTTTATAIGTCIPNPPSITPSSEGAWVLAAGGGTHNAGSFSLSSAGLEDFLNTSYATALDMSLGAGYINDWVSGAEDPSAFSLSGPNAAYAVWAAATMVLKPI